MKKAATSMGFFVRARVLFAAHRVARIPRVVINGGANFRAEHFPRPVSSLAGRHQRIRAYTPRRNGEVEGHNRLLANKVLCARTFASKQTRREVIGV